MYEASGSGSNYTAFKAGAQGADIVYTLPTSAGSNGQVLTTNGSGVLSWGIVGFQYFTENRNAIAPNTSRPVHQLIVSGDESDIDLALSPKGGGALAASVANGIPSGGNKRGAGAVDWQTRRNAAEFVASGIGAVLGGGTDNTASGMNAVVAGGQGNVASGNNSAIIGGRGLTLSGNGSVGFLGKNTGGHNMNISAINTAVFGNVDLWLINNDSVSREMRFYEKSSAGNHYTAFKAQDQAANVTYSLPSGDGSNGQVLTTNGSGALYWSSAGSGALTHFTESVNTAAPNETIPIVRLLATNGATNADIALSPKGMGALTADPADNTPTGGNKRGAKAIDWQMQRTSAYQIASGDHSVIGGGADNAAIGQYAVAAGGYNNNAAGYANAIGGGAGNFGNASFATIAGGSTNTASATYASVGGGDDNTASGIYSVVSGGFNNIADGFSASINGGNANEVHGQYSAINGGELNIINADYSAILGGNGLTLQADRSIGFNANNEFGTRAMSVNAPNTAVFNNVDFWLTNNDNTTRSLRFYEQYNTDGAFPNSTNYIGFKAPNAINADIIWTLPAADGTNGQVLTTNGAGQLTWASGSATLQNFAETVNNAAPNTAVPVVQFTATNSATNVDIALTPKGNGSLAAHSATATAAGGNKRGANAVDWQTLRSLATEIASGTAAVIGGGGGNTASGTYSTIAGGLGNGATQGYATIGGGAANAANGAYSTIGGGVNNTINAGSSAIPGGSGLTLNGTGSFGFLANHAGTNAMAIAENNVAVFANTNLWLANNDANPSELRFYEANTVTNGNFPPAALNYTAFKAQPQTANITYTLPADDGNPGQILATDGTGMLSWADASAGALSHFVESYHNDGNNGSVTVSRLSASTATANVDIALSPRGVGALLANLPDGTATGGNKRGQNAVDWQLSRNSNLQVASGNFTVISGGQYNRASSDHAAIGGGIGNLASGQIATISGGQNNTASSAWATVSGGFNNTASGSSSVVVGGFGNIAGGENTTILGGRGLNLNGDGNIGFLGNNSGGPRNMTLNTSNTAVFANVDMWLINNDNTAHELRIYEASGEGDNFTAFKAQPQSESITYTLPATQGTNGQVLTNDGTGNLSWTEGGSLQHFSESQSTAAPNATTPVNKFAANGTETNIDIAITPKGNGALLANLPDGTATGGNKRGEYAIDLQMFRTFATQIADGNYSVISGGKDNTALGIASAISGGMSNYADGNYSTVSGGNINSVSGDFSSNAGGQENAIAGNWSTITGGRENTNNGNYSTILGGRGLTLSGNNSIGYLGNNEDASRNMTLNTSNTAVFANVDMWLINNDNTAHELRIYEASGEGDNYTAFKAQAQTETITYTLPATAPPATGYVMTVQESSGNNATLGWGKRIIQLQDTPVDCANLNGGGGNATVDITVTDAVVGGTVHVSPRQAMEGGIFIAYAFIPSNGTVRIMFINATAGDIDPDSVNMDITVIQP